jgi:hypothetical protein
MRRYKVDALTRRKVHVAAVHVIGIRRDGVIDVCLGEREPQSYGRRRGVREVIDRRPRGPAHSWEATTRGSNARPRSWFRDSAGLAWCGRVGARNRRTLVDQREAPAMIRKRIIRTPRDPQTDILIARSARY